MALTPVWALLCALQQAENHLVSGMTTRTVALRKVKSVSYKKVEMQNIETQGFSFYISLLMFGLFSHRMLFPHYPFLKFGFMFNFFLLLNHGTFDD